MSAKPSSNLSNNESTRWNPFTYGVLTIVLIVGSLLFGYQFVIVELILLFILAAVSGVLGSFTKAWAKSALVLTIIVTVLQLLLIPGDTVVFEFFFIDITDNAVSQALSIASMILGVFSPIIYFLEVVDIEDFTTMMQQSGVNPQVTHVLSSALNMIPQMEKKLNTIADAQKSRGVETEGNLWIRMKAFIPIIAPVILSSISDVEEKTITLEVRGFSTKGPKTLLKHVEDTNRDKTVRKILWGILIVLVIVRVIAWF